MKRAEATVSLGEGETSIKVLFFQGGGPSGCILKYKGPDSENNEVTIPKTSLLTTTIMEGLRAELFLFPQGDKIPDLENADSIYQTSVFSLDYDRHSDAESIPAKIFGDEAHESTNYAMRFTGVVKIGDAGKYKFFLNSDDGSKMYMDKKLLIDNDGAHGMREKSGEIQLAEGEHAVRIEFYQGGGGHGLQWKYQGPDTDGQKKVVEETHLGHFDQVSRHITRANGLHMQIFHLSIVGDKEAKLESYQLASRSPKREMDVPNVNYPSTSKAWPGFDGRNYKFAVRWTGAVKVESSGKYYFSLDSDDGSVLYSGNKRIINNNGLHGMRRQGGNVQCNQGSQNSIRIEFIEAGGGAGCIFRYKGTDTGDKEVVVPQFRLIKNFGEASSGFRNGNLGFRTEVFNYQQGSSLKNNKGRKASQICVKEDMDMKAENKKRNNFCGGDLRRDDWAIRYTGVVNIAQSGNYKFWLTSDDGSKMWVNGKLVVDNDGNHGMRERSGKTQLTAVPGTMSDDTDVEIRIEHYQGGGGSGLEVRWSVTPDGSKQEMRGYHYADAKAKLLESNSTVARIEVPKIEEPLAAPLTLPVAQKKFSFLQMLRK